MNADYLAALWYADQALCTLAMLYTGDMPDGFRVLSAKYYGAVIAEIGRVSDEQVAAMRAELRECHG